MELEIPMTAEPPTVALLKELIEEVRLLSEAFDSFSSEGFPLKQSTPTSEMVMAAAVTAAMLARETPHLHPQDIEQRVQSAVVLAYRAVETFDAFHRQTAAAQLENTLQR
jgi:hypothetical protein